MDTGRRGRERETAEDGTRCTAGEARLSNRDMGARDLGLVLLLISSVTFKLFPNDNVLKVLTYFAWIL